MSRAMVGEPDPLAALILTESAESVTMALRVIPRARRSAIDGVVDGALRVRIAAPPVEGAANKAVIAYLAAALGLSKRDLSLISGEQSRHKVLLVRGLRGSHVRQRLAAYLAADH